MLRFRLHKVPYAIAALAPEVENLAWVEGEFSVVVRSPKETTVVCLQSAVPAILQQRGGLRCLEILDTSDLDSVGIVAAATAPLAAAGVSLFVFSTWSTDIIFIKEEDSQGASEALAQAGHTVDLVV